MNVPCLGHQRDLAEVDLLLLDVADDALAAFVGVVDHELRRHLDRRREGHAALAALVDVVLGLLEVVRDEHELARAVEVLDRKDAPEDALQPDVLALVRRDVRSEGTCRSDDFWMSMRFGISMIRLTRPRFLRMRKLDWMTIAIVYSCSLREARHLIAAFGTPHARSAGSRGRHSGTRTRSEPRRARAEAPKRDERDGTSPRAVPAGDSARLRETEAHYLSSTLAPASSSFFLISSASSLETPSLRAFGAPSTRSLASLRPRPVISRTP